MEKNVELSPMGIALDYLDLIFLSAALALELPCSADFRNHFSASLRSQEI